MGDGALMGEVVPFPLRRRVGLVRETATRIFHSRTNRAATSSWRRTADTLFRQMDRMGVESHCAEAEVTAFHRAVCAELDYLAAVPIEPGGSAA